MSIKAKAASAIAGASVLAIGWNVGISHNREEATQTALVSSTGQTTNGSGTGTSTLSSGSSNTVSDQANTANASGTASGSIPDGTYTGESVTYKYGTISVSVTYSGGKITSVSENLQSDGSGKSESIDSQAIPMLRSEVVSANSANISSISGATYTSQAYETSLQSAIDQAQAKA